MSSEGAPPPEDGSTPADQAATAPEKAASADESSASPPPPPAEADQSPPTEAAETTQPQPEAAADATPATPSVPVGTTPVGPGQPGAAGIPAFTPPPPVRKRAPPAKHKADGDETDPRLVIGVVAGAVLLLLFITALICCACWGKKKRKKRKQQQFGGQDHIHYYSTGGPNGGKYYTNHPHSHPHKKWHNSDHHVLHIPPPMGTPGPWGEPFSPTHGPPGGPHSADMSSTLSSPRSHHHATLPLLPPSLGFNKNSFSYDELVAATSGFAQSNLLGQGGFGYVHKGVLPNGKEVAVKSLKSGSGQDEREFQAEVEIISRVHHRHLVSLVGYCIAQEQRMLVYEYVPNNNLEFHLHGRGRPPIEWGMRMKIAMGSAKGLAYLHEDCHPRIIHRDIKTANILLDYSFEAQVADFGLAKLSSDKYTHVSTRIMGTFGYLAPEYASSGQLTEKSDVYSFGIMMLELITGRRPVDTTGQMEETLVDWARPLLQQAMEDGNYDPFADPRLENKYAPHEMKRMVACASASIRHSARRRPKMSQIVRALEGHVSLEDLNDGVRPGQSVAFGAGGGAAEEGADTYSAQMRKFRKMALETEEYSSSEFGATSEYGLNPSVSSSDSGESKESINQTEKLVP